MSKSKFAAVAAVRGRTGVKKSDSTDAQTTRRTDTQTAGRTDAQAITDADIAAITPDQSGEFTTVGCKLTRAAAHHFAIEAKRRRLPVADVIRRALLEVYGVPPPGQ